MASLCQQHVWMALPDLLTRTRSLQQTDSCRRPNRHQLRRLLSPILPQKSCFETALLRQCDGASMPAASLCTHAAHNVSARSDGCPFLPLSVPHGGNPRRLTPKRNSSKSIEMTPVYTAARRCSPWEVQHCRPLVFLEGGSLLTDGHGFRAALLSTADLYAKPRYKPSFYPAPWRRSRGRRLRLWRLSSAQCRLRSPLPWL